MPEQQTPSEYNQVSFLGGMNLLGDDTRLETNQYRLGINITNRLDELDLIPSSILDDKAPIGLKHGLTTFGNYLVLFCTGKAYYKYYNATNGWTQIDGFNMSPSAAKYWFVPIPVATTNYLRLAATSTMINTSDALGTVNIANVAGASGGNLPGLLVQDNINQPQFIFINYYCIPEARTTQKFNEWLLKFTDDTNTTVASKGDLREYVPIGNEMAWDDGVLYLVSQDFNKIYRSVSGRPLDFAVNVSNALVTVAPFIMVPGGDAETTAYSVGVGGITCLKTISSGGIFVSASTAGTITIYDSATTTTTAKVIDTFTGVLGTWYPIPVSTTAGIYIVVTGTLSATVVFA